MVFAGGGTGGHVYPALAIIEALQEMGKFEILYVGGYHGIENKIIPRRGIPFRRIWIAGFQRYFTLKNLLFPVKLIVSLMQSFFILKRFKPDAVVGTGGYVSGPPVYLASRMGIPVLIQEQNSYPGVTTRQLAKYADVVCAAFPEVKDYLPQLKGELLIAGNPVRKSLQITGKSVAAKKWNLDPSRPVIFIFGGSQGARSINQAMGEIAPALMEKYRVQLLWQTGERNFPEMQNWEIAFHPDVHILPYVEEIDRAYSVADIIVSRAGAITLAELSRAGKPCVLVPYPHAAANHQEHNAASVARAGAALVVKEDENLRENLRAALERLLSDADRARRMRESWEKFSRPDAAEKIAARIIQLIQKGDHDSIRKN